VVRRIRPMNVFDHDAIELCPVEATADDFAVAAPEALNQPGVRQAFCPRRVEYDLLKMVIHKGEKNSIGSSSKPTRDFMMSERIQVHPKTPDPEIIQRACMLLEAGELVGVPTETVYGIACDPAHLEKLYAAKERDRGKPIARLAASLEQVEALGAKFGKHGKLLAKKYWPGPLTLVLETPEGTTGFRVPDHEVPLALARAFGKPIALTSANISGGTDATNAQEAFQTLEAAVPLFLECFQGLEPTASDFRASSFAKASADRSPCPSTVLICTETETKVLREGAVSKEEIEKVVS